MLALIDGDILVYRVGFTTENENEGIAGARFNEMVEGILEAIGATEYQLWLSDSTANNFRIKYYPFYKANRKDFKKPKHYDFLKEFAQKEWRAQVTLGQEADDQLGIEQCQMENREWSIICTIDKDLDQIPGNHFNFVKETKYFVTPEQGRRYFYQQLLTGDTSDNIQGCPSIGSARADKALEGASSEGELFDSVRRCYTDTYKKKLGITNQQFVDDQILMNGICLKIRTREKEVWAFPTIENTTTQTNINGKHIMKEQKKNIFPE